MNLDLAKILFLVAVVLAALAAFNVTLGTVGLLPLAVAFVAGGLLVE